MPPAVVLFDLDGTLIEPIEGITASLSAALAAVGAPVPDPTGVRALIGPPLQEGLASLGLEPDAVDVALAAYRVHFEAEGLAQFTVHEGIADLLTDLHAAGRKLGVATSKPIGFAEAILARAGLDRSLHAVAGAELDGSRRHKHDVLAHALHLLGDPDPATAVLVGDRLHDVDGARVCGVGCIAVRWGHASDGELEAAQPDAIVATAAELRALLL
jgi:phosphoglycolate phosphatase